MLRQTSPHHRAEDLSVKAEATRFRSPAKTPPSLFGFIWLVSAHNQLGLALISILAFLAGIAPLELQRRIVNDTFRGGTPKIIILLAIAYAGFAALAGMIKLSLNVYRGYVGESATRWLRNALLDDLRSSTSEHRQAVAKGVEVSLVIDEADPIGGFVGTSVSEPLLQGGLLVGLFTYMAYLQPLMALIALAVFSPQFVFVPLMQRAINRRVADRVTTLRQISVGIVEEPRDRNATSGAQQARIQEVFVLNMGVIRLKFSMNFLMNLMSHLGIASILALGGYYVVQGKTEVGTVVAFISGLGQLNEPWGDLVNWFRDLRVTQTKYDLISRAVKNLRD
ncbi:ABC transporter transmembrane domain-containing protein [Microvirga sp. 17 mud 1-3]|uniref:ABC transporter transmembrane domain-containing protein n=1 Tax=Microvirga sp. 17 mud 1-3 TaxID=2082949 RepID=UPI000D6BBE2B|nr:ABC transporter transmembrane domain-containing protein [Microvirga sp. 17 mud 1-3]AWM85564.1 ABC transporter ATP-binding protein [Microvirga sp. 17 mud 1-3]